MDWLIDWLIDWLFDWVVSWFVDWLIDWWAHNTNNLIYVAEKTSLLIIYGSSATLFDVVQLIG